jgi:hypothetical protein
MERYAGLLYIEKAGFDPLIEQVQIAEKNDLAFMSCQGMSVTAAREIVDRTCAKYNIPLYIRHDFDISGFFDCQDTAHIEPPLYTGNRGQVRGCRYWPGAR